MKRTAGIFFTLLTLASTRVNGSNDTSQTMPLVVPAGEPLRLYLVKRIPKRLNAPVEAKLLAPVYAFDRQVIPAGTTVSGHVSSLQPVPKQQRARAIFGGDFTPLHIANIEFTSLLFPDGHKMTLLTVASPGLNSVYPLKPPRKQAPQNNTGGVLGAGKQMAKDQINDKLETVRSIPGMVRSPDFKDQVTGYLLSRLPYHPQYVSSRTRFNAELQAPLDFGSEPLTQTAMASLASQPAAGSIVHARLLTPLNSRSSTMGEKVDAVLEEPLFSDNHQLVLPQGTHLDGSVVVAKKAGWFHHSGRLRFNFQNIQLSPQVLALTAPPASDPEQHSATPHQKELQFQTRATLSAAESSGAPFKVDGEGGVKATDSKTRFIAAAASVLVARSAGQGDETRNASHAITGHGSNVGGNFLGGGMGFGLLGSAAAQASPNVGLALGYYGMAWNLYSTLIARGKEVTFEKNAAVDINFNARPSTTQTSANTNKQLGKATPPQR